MKYSDSMKTDSDYKPNMAYAWGAAAQINMIVDADDPDLWDQFFRFLRDRKIFDELAMRVMDEGPRGPEAA